MYSLVISPQWQHFAKLYNIITTRLLILIQLNDLTHNSCVFQTHMHMYFYAILSCVQVRISTTTVKVHNISVPTDMFFNQFFKWSALGGHSQNAHFAFLLVPGAFYQWCLWAVASSSSSSVHGSTTPIEYLTFREAVPKKKGGGGRKMEGGEEHEKVGRSRGPRVKGRGQGARKAEGAGVRAATSISYRPGVAHHLPNLGDHPLHSQANIWKQERSDLL